MDFGGSGGSLGGDSVNKEDVMEQVKQQIAVVNAQELLTVSIVYVISSVINCD